MYISSTTVTTHTILLVLKVTQYFNKLFTSTVYFLFNEQFPAQRRGNYYIQFQGLKLHTLSLFFSNVSIPGNPDGYRNINIQALMCLNTLNMTTKLKLTHS